MRIGDAAVIDSSWSRRSDQDSGSPGLRRHGPGGPGWGDHARTGGGRGRSSRSDTATSRLQDTTDLGGKMTRRLSPGLSDPALGKRRLFPPTQELWRAKVDGDEVSFTQPERPSDPPGGDGRPPLRTGGDGGPGPCDLGTMRLPTHVTWRVGMVPFWSSLNAGFRRHLFLHLDGHWAWRRGRLRSGPERAGRG